MKICKSKVKITHPAFRNKPKDNDKLWRFMNFEKFYDLIVNNQLHFTRIDQFDDTFEGTWSKNDFKVLKSKSGYDVTNHTEILKKNNIAASCWHRNKHESPVMWEKYDSTNQGVAIVTNFKTLSEQFEDYCNNNHDYFSLFGIANVNYIDFAQDTMFIDDRINAYFPFTFKHADYSYEQELRAIIVSKIGKFEICKSGAKVGINSKKLIHTIIINPKIKSENRKKIIACLEKFKLKDKLNDSNLVSHHVEDGSST